MLVLIMKRITTVLAFLGISAFFSIGNDPINGIVPNKKNRTVCFVTAVSTDKFVSGSNDSAQSL